MDSNGEKFATYLGDEITPSLRKSVDNIVVKEGFSNSNVHVKMLPADGKSFMGVLHQIRIQGNTPQGEKEIDIFVKCIIPGENLSIFSVSNAFEKEAYCYNELFVIFNELQDEYKIPIDERFKTAKGYGESTSEHIILEDLSKKGFTTLGRADIPPFDYATKSMQQLAKYHALTFVLQEKRPNYFEKLKSFEPSYYYGTEAWNAFLHNISSGCGKFLDAEAKQKVEKYIPTTYDKYKHYTVDANSVRCLCHGDYRMNNTMVKYQNGEVSELIPIDFQLVFYGCPVIDFLYFNFMNTDKEYRKNHLEDLKNIYHNAMADFLKHFNIDVEKYFPRSELDRIYKERLDYGLMTGLWVIPTSLANVDETPDYTKTDLVNLELNVSNLAQSRVRGIVEDFIDWGYL